MVKVILEGFDAHGNFKDLKESKMEFSQFVRKPFVVEAVEITVENIAEVAEYVGEVRHKEDGSPYIYVNRRLVPNVYRVYPGFYMTRMGDHIRCYTRKIFNEQFVVAEPNIITWVEWLNGDETPTPATA